LRRSGSHRRLQAPDHPPLTFAFHDGATIPGGLVRKILVKDIGLDEDEARKLLRGGGSNGNRVRHLSPT
jgi:hypothetical protein